MTFCFANNKQIFGVLGTGHSKENEIVPPLTSSCSRAIFVSKDEELTYGHNLFVCLSVLCTLFLGSLENFSGPKSQLSNGNSLVLKS